MDLKAVGLELDLGNFLTILLTEKKNNNNQIKMFPRNPKGPLNPLLWNSVLSHIDIQVLRTEKKTDDCVAL